MRPLLLALLALASFSDSAWAAKSWYPQKGPWACAVPLTPKTSGGKAAEDLENLSSSPFFDPNDPRLLEIPAYRALVEAQKKLQAENPRRLQELIEYMAAEAGFKVEPTPMVMRPEVATQLFAAAEQRARAAAALLQDLYASDSPKILDAYPEFKEIVRSSPLFAHEIVGTPAATSYPWNLNMAMDVVVANNRNGTYAVKVQESDSGSIGGSFRPIDDLLGKAWKVDLSRDFMSAKASLVDRIKRHVRNAKRVRLPDGKTGICVLYTEEEPLFHPGTEMYKLLTDHGVRIVSNYNKELLSWNVAMGRYEYLSKNAQGEVVDRLPVTDFWLEYYPEALDPQSPVYPRLPVRMRTDDFELSHALPGHWQRWQDGGFRNWHQDNAQGIELFTDKAIAPLLRLAIKFYLKEEPVLNADGYQLFKKRNRRETERFVNSKFSAANQKTTVVKSRRDSGQGHGVYLGVNMMNGEQKNGYTWDSLRQEVLAHPEEWIYQEFMQEEPLRLPDGKIRSYEIRIITYMEFGRPHVFALVYVRSSRVGDMHNLSGTRDRIATDPEVQSVIPVLIPILR